MHYVFFFIVAFFPSLVLASPRISLGIDRLMTADFTPLLRNKRIGLICNHTSVNSKGEPTVEVLKRHAKEGEYTLISLFAPEHGVRGSAHAEKHVADEYDSDGIPVYSLFGATMRPTERMLQEIDVFIYDIQDIGTRSYTYSTTLFLAMEEAAKRDIQVIVLDRPNPINGLIVDGPMVEEKWRSIVGYVNVPYCHGMTIGELAHFFNEEYHIGCSLDVVPMKGWKRRMSFQDTGLVWIPSSPHIPEPSTVFYYPSTGMLGELQLLNIGVWYSLPFKIVGAPWIDADAFSQKLNEQKFPGVDFRPFHFRPYYGRFAHQECHGVLIVITDTEHYKPATTQYLLLGMLKSLYPKQFQDAVKAAEKRKTMFCRVNGTEEVYRLMTQEKYIIWPLKELHRKEREAFLARRQKYLIPSYS